MKLRETLDLTEALGKAGELPDVELSENGMKISPLEGDRPDGSEALNGIANGMLPRLEDHRLALGSRSLDELHPPLFSFKDQRTGKRPGAVAHGNTC